jgi:hypothetical protein
VVTVPSSFPFFHTLYGWRYVIHPARVPRRTHTNCFVNMLHADDPEWRFVTDDDDRTMTNPRRTIKKTMMMIQ